MNVTIKPINAMTVDVEDYFQVSAFEQHVMRDRWDKLPHRVEQNTGRILDLFQQRQVKATFFTLGWVGERYPGLVRRIVAEGHELASHGYQHTRVTEQTPDQFREDLRLTGW
ncbi:polysaccharide deacetylase family protein [Methylomonas sp. DH-1]|uniref:polysaccharide deacetylase family protein n=1 Tax=Methylomonas sp. (strain DH-1) TaxID=1727196 RepID=UPI0009ED1DC4|nr:polysaccharide deacetylase family protein [Methylomonas sp. DH-1]